MGDGLGPAGVHAPPPKRARPCPRNPCSHWARACTPPPCKRATTVGRPLLQPPRARHMHPLMPPSPPKNGLAEFGGIDINIIVVNHAIMTMVVTVTAWSLFMPVRGSAGTPPCMAATKPSMPARFSASQMWESLPAVAKGSRLERMVPLKMTGSCRVGCTECKGFGLTGPCDASPEPRLPSPPLPLPSAPWVVGLRQRWVLVQPRQAPHVKRPHPPPPSYPSPPAAPATLLRPGTQQPHFI